MGSSVPLALKTVPPPKKKRKKKDGRQRKKRIRPGKHREMLDIDTLIE